MTGKRSAPSAIPRLCRTDLDKNTRHRRDKHGVVLAIFAAEALADYTRCATPEYAHAVCEDCRATVALDPTAPIASRIRETGGRIKIGRVESH
jgi:hypothetical protein